MGAIDSAEGGIEEDHQILQRVGPKELQAPNEAHRPQELGGRSKEEEAAAKVIAATVARTDGA